MRTLSTIRLIIALLIITGGLMVWIYDRIDKGLNYTHVTAVVERVGPVCYPLRSPSEAIDCSERRANPSVTRWVRGIAVWIRYPSPADRKEHHARLVRLTEKDMEEASYMKPGDQWNVLAHDDVPGDVKADR